MALENGTIRRFTVAPEDVGLARARPEDLKGSDPDHNARALRAVLDGEPGAYRDIAIMNAGAALVVAGIAPELREGTERAAVAVESGAAKGAFDRLVAVSNGQAR
jgi:anthranilate phosphoribosyltransferase